MVAWGSKITPKCDPKAHPKNLRKLLERKTAKLNYNNYLLHSSPADRPDKPQFGEPRDSKNTKKRKLLNKTRKNSNN